MSNYTKENIKPKLEFKETPSFVSGFAAPLGITGVQAAKNLAAKKGVLPLITTAKAFNMSAATVPTKMMALTDGGSNKVAVPKNVIKTAAVPKNAIKFANNYTASKEILPPTKA